MGKIIIDSNVFIALARKKDSLHIKAHELMERVKGKHEVWVLNVVVQESATVISMRDGMNAARVFFEECPELIDVEIKLDNELEKLSWTIFLRQQKKGTSFIDCANLALLEKYKLDGILSFDDFYPRNVRVV